MEIQGFMTPRFGLKFDTTSKYLEEMHLASIVKDAGRKWKVARVPHET